MTLQELFAPTFRSRADVAALEFGDASYTFGDLDRRSGLVAQFLLAKGFRAGDRLGVYLANRVEFIDLFLACVKTGIIFLPINILYREREVSHIASDAEPRAIVGAGPVPGVASFLDVADIARAASATSPVPAIATAPIEPSTPLALVYTSGTTGTAKGAILTHGNFSANTANLLEAWRFASDDRLLLPLPLFHVHGLGNGVCCWLASGCRMRLLERFEADKAAGEFLSFTPTVLFAVPTVYIRLLNLPTATAREIGKTMRLFVSGSAPLPAHVHDAFRAAYGHSILERYGMTETMMNCSNPYGEERRPGTVGFPLPGVSVRIVTSGSDTPHVEQVPVDETGDVWVKGANVFPGYWRRDEATRAAFVDGWFKTGDIGVRSADGYISLRGRATDLIISGGFNIYPREIEEVILDSAGVREAVVVGVPDPVRGEVPVAYLATGDGYDEAALREHLKKTLASFKMPRAFVRIDKLPRTALGKVQKHLLPAWKDSA
ncbi:MAG TPA: AMP-binding protein [Vicinamibacterales bacterium]|nr:AMP-binding protein [Vicinamibacterales bacterium]